ncbi:hypothetical protein AMS68_004143 [Peltaster fructicola]|uniref:Carbohydrate kinase PfkB domain-containing protein n=1 Tax=Peltaster fructicola TaxID=286661 RepID=A0A6H0XVB2_9PEZI|nr:hypothetical protein AMS68_004143 [Peltaster fructicola]
MKSSVCSPWRSLTSLSRSRETCKRCLSLDSRHIIVSEEVRQAVIEQRPVVALESTIYTHGFPYPENVALASSLESIVRATGATPATIGILDGIARVGLEREELIRLAASSQDPKTLLKVSRRDLGYALATSAHTARRYNGGTTVAATMLLANLAGIKIFATGGLGGVHRGAQDTFDISADLTELGRTPVAVIASGCKAFLDIAKTLEYLETQGVGVITMADGRGDNVDFPGFWSRDSGHRSPMSVNSEAEAAAIIYTQASLRMQSGILFGNPVPAQHEIPYTHIKESVDKALIEAAKAGATGNRATPFILAKMKELTGSQSVKANTALVESNVSVGARIAVELSKLQRSENSPERFQPSIPEIPSHLATIQDHSTVQESPAKVDVFVAGMLAVDFACDYTPREQSSDRPLELSTSNPARIIQSLGGVGHNVALAAHRAGASVRFCSAVGDDMNGQAALEALRGEGLSPHSIVHLPQKRTAQYVAVNDNKKDLVVAMADMSILDDNSVVDKALATWTEDLHTSRPTHTVLDANWSSAQLQTWINATREVGTHTTFEPVSNAKSTGIFLLPATSNEKAYDTLNVFPQPSIHLVTPNASELSSMYEVAHARGFFESRDWWEVIDAFGIPSTGARPQMVLATSNELVDQGIPQKSLQLLPYLPCITTKLGAQGVLLTQILSAGDPRLTSPKHAPYILSRCTNGSEETTGVGGVYLRLFPAPEQVEQAHIVSVNGVGDTFAGVLVASLAKCRDQGRPEYVEELLDLAQRASILTLKSKEAVSSGLTTLATLL